MKTSTNRVRWGLVIAFSGFMVLVGNAPGGLILDESFTAPVGQLPNDWYWFDEGRGRPLVVENIGPDERNALRVGRETTIFYAQGSEPLHPSNPVGTPPDPNLDFYADLQGSVLINTGTMFDGVQLGAVGVLVRYHRAESWGTVDTNVVVDGTAGEPGYQIVFSAERNNNNVNPDGHYPFIGIGLGQNNFTHRTEDGSRFYATTKLAENTISNNTDYVLHFSAVGSVISASLWTVGATPEMLAFVSIEDAEFTDPGYFGLTGHSSSNTKYAYLSDLQVIPEPGTASLFLISLLALAAARRRRTACS